MVRLNIHEAKTHLSSYLARVAKGETIVLCKRNTPVAEIRPLPSRRTKRRPMGLAAGQVKIPKEFFDPLPAEFLDHFEGKR